MKSVRREMLTATWAAFTLINGGYALSHNNQAVSAESSANVYEQEGNFAQASEYKVIAHDAREDRTSSLILGALGITLVGLNGLSVIEARNDERREKEKI